MNSKTDIIKINNINLEYTTTGHGKRELLFLHGGTMSFRAYIPFFKHLSKVFTIWAPSLPGSGKSSNIPQVWTEQQIADTIHKFTKEMALRPIIAGHSFGGGIAILTKSTYPASYKETILFAPVGIISSPTDQDLQKITKTVIKGKLRNLIKYPPNVKKDILLNLALHYKDFPRIRKFYKELNLVNNLKQITDKTILILGKNDSLIPIEKVQKIPKNVQKYILDTSHDFVEIPPSKILNIIKKELNIK